MRIIWPKFNKKKNNWNTINNNFIYSIWCEKSSLFVLITYYGIFIKASRYLNFFIGL